MGSHESRAVHMFIVFEKYLKWVSVMGKLDILPT